MVQSLIRFIYQVVIYLRFHYMNFIQDIKTLQRFINNQFLIINLGLDLNLYYFHFWHWKVEENQKY